MNNQTEIDHCAFLEEAQTDNLIAIDLELFFLEEIYHPKDFEGKMYLLIRGLQTSKKLIHLQVAQ